MTNQPTNNEWIHKSFRQFMYELGDMDIPVWFDKFKQAILDNLPQSISREAVEKLREKYIKVNNDKDHDFYGALGELLSELYDFLISNP